MTAAPARKYRFAAAGCRVRDAIRLVEASTRNP